MKRGNTTTLTELFNRITVLSTEVLASQLSTQGYIIFITLAAVALISFVLLLICARQDTNDLLKILLAVVSAGCCVAVLLTPRFVPLEPSQMQITVSVPQNITVDDLTKYFTVVEAGNLNDECIITLETNQDLDTYEEVMAYLQGNL